METTLSLKPRLLALTQKSGFDSVLELMSILHDLSIPVTFVRFPVPAFVNDSDSYNSRRIEKAFEHLRSNYAQNITLGEVAKLVNMTQKFRLVGLSKSGLAKPSSTA